MKLPDLDDAEFIPLPPDGLVTDRVVRNVEEVLANKLANYTEHSSGDTLAGGVVPLVNILNRSNPTTGMAPPVLVGFDPNTIKQRRVDFHDLSLCRRCASAPAPSASPRAARSRRSRAVRSWLTASGNYGDGNGAMAATVILLLQSRFRSRSQGSPMSEQAWFAYR